MANYDVLKNAIRNAVDWDNNDKQISGNDMLAILLSIINNTVSAGYLFAGIAVPDTNPGTPDQNIFYIAGPGTYPNFGTTPPTVQEGYLGVFRWNRNWSFNYVPVGKDYTNEIEALKKTDNWIGSSRANIAFSSNSVTISPGWLYFVRGGVLSISYENLSERTYTFSASSYLCFNISSRTFGQKTGNELQADDLILLYYDAVKGFSSGLFYSYYQNSLIAANKAGIDDINDYSVLVGNGGVYRLRLDETKRLGDSTSEGNVGKVIPRTSDGQNFAILTEFSPKEVYSVSFDERFQYDLFYHLKKDLDSDSFIRRTTAQPYLHGLTVFQDIVWWQDTYTIDDIDRIRIRISGVYRDGGANVQFSDLVANLNPEITTFVDILKPIKLEVDTFMSGELSALGFYASGKKLADSTQLSEGDVIDYEFSNEDENEVLISNAAIGFFMADGTRIFYLGGSGLNQIVTFRGSIRVPAEFSYAQTMWNGSPFKLTKFVRRKNANYLYEGVNRAIPKNILFSGDFTYTAPGSATTTRSIGKYYFTEGNLPEKIYIKCDSVSPADVKDDVLRIDMYDSSGLDSHRKYGYYRQSAIGSWVEIEVPNDIVYISLVAPIQIALSDPQTITFENIVLSLSPSEKEYVISDKVFIDGISEEKGNLFENEVKETAQRITELCKRPCLAFNILTDTHEKKGDSESERLINQTFKNVRRVSDISFSDGLIHTGDILYPYSSSDLLNPYTDWHKVNEHLDEYVGKLRKLNSRVYVCMGNHDGLYSQQVNEFYTYGSLEKFNERYTVRENFQPWYYFDNEKTKTRVIFLTVPSRDAASEEGPIFYSIGPNQMQWLAYVALNLPDTWNVLIFSHIHVYDDDFSTSDSSATVFAALTTAFCTQSTYSNQDFGINVDFSWRASGKILAMVSGHTHADGIIRDNTDFSSYNLLFPIITVASSNMLMRGTTSVQHHPNTYTDPARTKGTVTEELWDTLIYRPDLNKIFMVRFGAGNDREINV